jgi:preprotein translocase subunit SecF
MVNTSGTRDDNGQPAELTESSAEDLPALDDLTTAADGVELPHHNFFTRLYTGTGAFEVIGRRRMWFAVSGLILLVAIASIAIRGFTFGIDFQGGTKVSMPAGNATTEQVEQVFHDVLGRDPESVVIVGNGAAATVQIRSETLANDQTATLRQALFDRFAPKGSDGQPSKDAISDSAVSETWGGQITSGSATSATWRSPRWRPCSST